MNAKMFCWMVLIPALALSACSLPAPAVPAGPQAWFDAPLPGTQLPLAPTQLVSHFSDPDGLSEIELTVNGSVLGTFPVAAAGQSLVTDTRTWTPQGPGQYALWVRARGPRGVWSDYARTYVVVGDGVERAAVDATPTGTPTATPVGEAGFDGLSLSANTVYAGRCGASQVAVGIKAHHPVGIKAVILFFRIEAAEGGQLSPWTDGVAMNLGADGFYTRTLDGASLADLAGFSFERAIVHYQFVIQPLSGDLVRSQVYGDLQLLACGAPPPPARFTQTPRPPHMGP